MSMIPTQQPQEYEDGRTKQSFKDSCDINNLLRRAQQAGGVSHLRDFSAEYGDFTDIDFETVQNKLLRANQIFEQLPYQIKKEFDQNPGLFFEFANDPQNTPRLQEMYRILAQPGRQLPTINDLLPSLEGLEARKKEIAEKREIKEREKRAITINDLKEVLKPDKAE